MLNQDKIDEIKQEIVMARKINEEYLEAQMREALERYTGEYTPFIGQNWDIALNEIYPVIQFNYPSIYFRNPRVFLKPRTKYFIGRKPNPITRKMEEVFLDSAKSAKTQESSLNYIIKEIAYKREAQKCLMDALLFKFAVMWHGYRGDFGMQSDMDIFTKPGQLFVERVSPMRFLKDPAVYLADLPKARWVARSFDIALEDLIEDDDLSVDKKIKGLHGFGDRMSTGRPSVPGSTATSIIRPQTRPLIDFANEDFRKSKRSRFVEVFEVFVRPTPKEARQKKKGHYLLLTFEQDKALKQRDWPYKAEGWPPKILQFNPLNDNHFGLADIDTYKTAADQKNAIVNLQLRNAQENSRVWVVMAKDALEGEEEIEAIRRGEQTIVLMPGDSVQGKFALASPSGQGSSELYLIDQRIQKNLEDKSGVTDLKRGFLQSGEESAASVKIRAAGGSVRPQYRQDIMADFLKDSFHYLNQLNKQFFTVEDIVRIVGSLDIEWSDRPTKEEIQADVDVEMDVTSMLPENPEKEIQELQTVLALMVEALTNPQVAQKLQQEQKTINLSPVIENLLMRLKIRDPEVFRAIRPEESQGFVSVSELRAARDNVNAIAAGDPQLPSPPEMGQDHRARTELYVSILNLIQQESEISQKLQQLILIHQQLLDEEQKKQSPKVRSPLKKQQAITTPSLGGNGRI